MVLSKGPAGGESATSRREFQSGTRVVPLAEAHRSLVEGDLLIATDCISEGQNLQDCDLVINYDIHWNPVRIIQRFGRIGDFLPNAEIVIEIADEIV